MKTIFSDFEIKCLRKDHMDPGVFLKARKPLDWTPTNLDNTALYSIILGKRTKEIPSIEDAPHAGRRQVLQHPAQHGLIGERIKCLDIESDVGLSLVA